jgi:hypothetical protein
MGDVPLPEREPLPEHEPIPATPWGPNPDYGDLPQRAGDLQVGEVKDITPADPDLIFLRYEPTKHLHPGPLGFIPTDKGGE